MANRPTHFEIHVENAERAQKFYIDVFGWKFDKWEGPAPYWLITTGVDGEPGINGGMVMRMGANPPANEPTPVIAYVCTVNVDDIDASIEKVKAAGGTEALAKMDMGMGVLAYYKDTESNIFGMMQVAAQPEPRTGRSVAEQA